MATIQSSQEFIRALKAPSDPPNAGGPTKIELAQQGWTTNTFYLPSKAEVIVEWLLSSYLKCKSQSPSTSPVFSLKHWKLLLDVLSHKPATNARPLRTWLAPLLLRTPLHPILSIFLAKFKEVGSPTDLATTVSSCFSILWTTSSQKSPLENLVDLFNLILQVADEGDLPLGIINIGNLITTSYRFSLGNSVNKKKYYLLFLHSSFSRWLRVVSKHIPSSDSTLEHIKFRQNIYDSGTEILFNLDILRQLSEHRPTDQSTALFDHLNKARSALSEAPDVLSVLPRLSLSYIHAVKRHRGAVFSQSSSFSRSSTLNDEVNAASMRFFVNCEAVLRTPGVDDGHSVMDVTLWGARLSLLECVFDEKLFSVQQEDASLVLRTIVKDAIDNLRHSWQDLDQSVISLAVKCLHKTAQIDCDLLLPFLPQILSLLLPLTATNPTLLNFFDLVLDYHSKTRTLTAHVQNLLASFEPSSFPPSQIRDISEVYQLCFSGHFLNSRHLEKVGQAIRTFLTPGQCLPCVESLLKTLEDSWRTFHDVVEGKGDIDESQKKKKKAEDSEYDMAIDSTSKPLNHERTYLALSFSLQAHLAHLVLASLPIQSLSEESASGMRGLLSRFQDRTVRKSLGKLLKVKRLSPTNGTKKRKKETSDGANGWDMQIVATAMLRLEYALCVSTGLDFTPAGNMEKVVEQMEEVISKEGGKGNLIAELELEIFRLLLYHISSHEVRQDHALQVFESILSYLSASFEPSNTTWSGLPCLSKEPRSGALAVLHLILEGYLPLVDHLASPSQLTTLIQLILNINIDSLPSTIDSNLSPGYLLLRLLQSAEFWEMQNLRSAFLSYLTQITSDPVPLVQDTELIAYRLLHYTPAEYFTKAARTHFVRRAYRVDIQLVKRWNETKKKNQDDECKKALLLNLITTRVFLKRVIQTVGFERVSGQDIDLGDYVIHLMSFDCEIEDKVHDEFIQSTLDLTGLCFSELLRNSNIHSRALLNIINSFGQYPVFVGTSDGHSTLQSQLIAKQLLEVTKLKKSSILPAECLSSLRGFYARMSRTLLQQIQVVTPLQIIRYSETLTGWCCILDLRRWLDEYGTEEMDAVGRRLVSITLQLPADEKRIGDVRTSILAILYSEMTLMKEMATRQAQLEFIIATFIVFHCDSEDTTRSVLDNHVSFMFKALTTDDYSYALNLIFDSISSGSLEKKNLETSIHLSNLLLRAHPQHTFKPVQAFVTQSLDTFASSQTFIRGNVPLRLLILEFVVQHCSERPATLRSIDIGSIFLILFRFLEPSEEHDERTTREIFHKIVATLSALLRLRRDLVVTALPHIGLLLRRLLLSMRSCRPQLGTKQTAIVMKTQPRWIAPGGPLGSDEGRLLSRLLETLDVKTIVRSHAIHESQKAESVRKPFSKHAAYVLAAYIEALNDPLCVLSMEIRRELEPGILTLCEIMGEHARDALVVGLDGNGKAALKLIWKEYEKQRYVGKG